MIAASDSTVDALFASAGVIRCDGLDDLLDAAAVMSEQPLPTGSGVAIIANARGPLVVCADACTDSGLNVATLSEDTQRALTERLPATSVVAGPVQLVASESPDTFAAVAELVAADPGVDAVIAIFVEHIATGADDVAAALAALSLPIPLLTVFMTPGNLPVVLRRGATGRRATDLSEPSEGAAPQRPAARFAAAAQSAVARVAAAAQHGAAARGAPSPRATAAQPDAARATRPHATAGSPPDAVPHDASSPSAAPTPRAADSSASDAVGRKIPTFRAPERAARALGRAAAYARWRATPATEPPVLDDVDADAAAAILAGALARGGGWLRPDEVEALLAAYGIALVEQRRVSSVAAAAKAAAELGGDVALKGIAPGIVHKAQAGAVRLGLSGPTAAKRAAQEIATQLEAAGTPAAEFLVQRMADPGVEMLVGVLADERFGPVVACGAGGGTAEVLGDVQVRLAPLAREDALDMISRLRSLALLHRADADVERARGHRRAHRRARRRPPRDRRAGSEPGDGLRRGRCGGRRARPRRAARRPARVPGGRAVKRIGLLGGMSWESTAEYYRLINQLVAEQLGGLHSADCLLRSVDFAEIEALQREGLWSEAGERLAREAQHLEAAGAELLVLCTNTMHKVAAEIEIAITIPFVHIADTTAAGGARRRPGPRRPARHRLHDGAGLLRRPAAHGAQPGRARARPARPQDRPRRDLRGAVPRRHQGRRRATSTAASSARSWSAARRPSCSAAPRSTC